MKICFIMYPWGRISPETDTTLRLIHECVKRDYFVAITTPNKLTIRESTTSAFCKVVIKQKPSNTIPIFYKKITFRKHMLPLAGFDAIFMRANPPLDALALNFLDSVRNDTFIINDIEHWGNPVKRSPRRNVPYILSWWLMDCQRSISDIEDILKMELGEFRECIPVWFDFLQRHGYIVFEADEVAESDHKDESESTETSNETEIS